MKKFIRIAAGVLFLLVVGLVVLYFSLGSLLRSGIAGEASRALDTEVKVESAKVRLFSGNATLAGLIVANPPGFQSPQALTLEDLDVQASIPSFLSRTVEISEARLDRLHLTVEEAGLKTNVGLLIKKLKANRERAESAGQPTRRYRIGLLRISGARATLSSSVLGGEAREAAITDLELRNIGTAEGGATLAEVAAQVLDAVLREVLKDSSIPEAARRVLSGELDLKGAVEGVIEGGKEALEKGVEDARKSAEDALHGTPSEKKK